MLSVLYKWFITYKLLHLVMWLLVASTTFFVYYDPQGPLLPQICNAAAVNLVATIPFYLNAYYLIPKFLYKHQYIKFIFLFIVLVAFSGILMLLVVRTVDYFFDPSREIISKDFVKLRFDLNLFIWTALIAAFGSGGLKIMSDSFRLQKRLFKVEKEKLSAELNFLRSQINPHFLFNVMNLIYFQISKENSAARESILRYSEMLRYQLYECTSDEIEIQKELEYIKNYVSIQSLRMEKGSDIQLLVCPEIGDFKIAPLLILPLIENAFKHVSNYKVASENKIIIELKQSDDQNFFIHTVNTCELQTSEGFYKSNGLGIANLKRRLELLYPENHELSTQKIGNLFKTSLKIKYGN